MEEEKMLNLSMQFKNLKEMTKCLRYWQHVLCLDHWYIVPRLVDELVHEGDECWGLNIHEQVNRTAVISVRKYRPEDAEAPKKYCAEQILVHELLHCHYNWLQKDTNDHDSVYYSVKDHQQLELMAEALIMAKYNIDRSFFYNDTKKD